MKNVHELFSELDDWKAYKPASMMSSIAKSNHISRLEREIKKRIDIEDYKDYILSKEGNRSLER
ncbi:hypothetical protein [Lacicoccus alkaliphilus]|uniref:Uncharacterized protein n=1 Tax=Lacicoccus alkaliphilus DSM 16010 TaxID=1123231 RepID=A0A1M7KKD5_9BACL|nr:hypothetical protein [Salinicoccus alkaliphilus]SHM65836.1 hypothetical protein SAMN02745189_02571 [Salinicoccus alkaliphilus DSM 16010]